MKQTKTQSKSTNYIEIQYLTYTDSKSKLYPNHPNHKLYHMLSLPPFPHLLKHINWKEQWSQMLISMWSRRILCHFIFSIRIERFFLHHEPQLYQHLSQLHKECTFQCLQTHSRMGRKHQYYIPSLQCLFFLNNRSI